ncbi:MAG: LysR family transcriptional regulator [Pseudomonadota bacterium]
MTPRVLTTLIAVADSGSFARAAQACNMTLSAVSMQMKALEVELDAHLFDRSFRPPKLTPLGRRVSEEARRVIAAHDDVLRLCQAPGTLKGDFRIGFVMTSSVRLLQGFLARSGTEFPDARFAIETGLSDDLLARVAEGALDAAIITGGEDLPRGTRETVLAHEELVYCLPLGAEKWPITACMDKLTFIHFMPQAGIGRLIARHLAAGNLTPRDTIVLDTVEAVAECVRSGVGFGILPKPDVLRYARGEIHLRALSRGKTMRTVVLVTRAGTAADAGAETLAKALAA